MINKMKLFIFISILIFGDAQANATLLSAPFQMQTLTPNAQLTASYVFGSHQGMFCYDVTMSNVGYITFPQNGNTIISNLPAILTNKSDIEGGIPADPSGNITIGNTQKQSIYVYCNFIF